MRHSLAVLSLIHGVAHLVGFAVSWRLINSAEQPYRTTILQGRVDLGDWGIRLYGLGWLALAVCFAAVAGGILLRSSWWLAALEGLVAVSLAFCVLGWPETRLGVLVNLVLLGLAFATIRFHSDGLAIKDESLETLWRSAPPSSGRVFDPNLISDLPLPAQHYLKHAIAPGTPLASAVHLKMHGEIKLDDWRPFRAEQVISQDGNFVWAATVSMYGFPIRGSDRLLAGEGSMRWKLFDLIPVMTGSGPHITRSGIGRLQGELLAWLPSVLLADGISWTASESAGQSIRIELLGESTEIEIKTGDQGGLKTLKMQRWGNPAGDDHGEHRYVDFGVIVEEERRFSGFTIPSRIRAGWFFGTERFGPEGEFFRATIDSATYQ